MALVFGLEAIEQRYEQFVHDFLHGEVNVQRTEVLPRVWVVTVPEKNFNVTITCKCIGHFHGIEEWCAIVEEPNGDKSNFMLFEEEIKEWAAEQRKARGFE